MIRTQSRKIACMRLPLVAAGCASSARDGADANVIERTARSIGSDLPALKKDHYPKAELYVGQAIKATPSHCEKAERDLQYVMQSRGANTGDEMRALSTSNHERRW